ncbi:hypothetical protein GBA52_023136 [Prunus armeniaca]|nr:hypothetical protein GBA52_023136 [Prunus armeniaca]
MQHIVSDDLRYWHFDFHHICGHVHFERLSILYEQIVDFLDRNGCGKRTMQGIAKDGINALLRYYFNNFVDGTKQDAIDLLQGHYIVSVSRDMTPSSQKGGLEAVAGWDGTGIMLVHSGFFSGENVVNIFANLQSNDFSVFHSFAVRYDLRHLFFSVIWAGLSVAIAAFVRANGRIFCNRPRLHKPRC